jgi:outer membrane protein
MTISRLISLFSMFAAAAIAALLFLPGGALAQQAERQIVKVGYVNTERVMREARIPKQAKLSLEADFQKREREIVAGKAPDMERRRALLGEEMAARRDETVKQIIEKANQIIKRIAERENFDAVFIEAAYADKRIDITDQVIKALDAER